MASTGYEQVGSLSVKQVLFSFVENELLPAAGLESLQFWQGLETLVTRFSDTNRELLHVRDLMQQKIDDWHGLHDGPAFDHDEYVAFLREIGYLVPDGEPFQVETRNVDREIAEVQVAVAVAHGTTGEALVQRSLVFRDRGAHPAMQESELLVVDDAAEMVEILAEIVDRLPDQALTIGVDHR